MLEKLNSYLKLNMLNKHTLSFIGEYKKQPEKKEHLKTSFISF